MPSQVQRTINKKTGLSGAGARKKASNNVKSWMRNKFRRKSEGGNGG